jgi:hypothetical protein
LILTALFIVFWSTSSIYSVYTFDSGESGKRVHLLGVLIQEEGYFLPDREYHHTGIPHSEVIFNVFLVTFLILMVYLSWCVVFDVVRCFPRDRDCYG